MEQEQKEILIRSIVTAGLLLVCWLLPLDGGLRATAFLIPYLLIGWDILWKAVKKVFKGKMLDEHFLMAIASLGAFLIGEYPEGVAVMLFYRIGELFEDYAVDQSKKSIADLMQIRPDWARVMENGRWVQSAPEEVPIGAEILIQPGERIPLDGVVLEGKSLIDTSALTGESMPKEVAEGDRVLSGTVCQNGVLRIQVTHLFGESTVAKILDLVENAAGKKAKAESFITRFAKVYAPCVVIAAVLLAVIPPLLVGGFVDWLYRALTFLVISCPCALVISVPMTFFGGIGTASAKGILIKGGNYLEALSKLTTIVFDKTGTLTEGKFSVTEQHPEAEEDVLALAALAEQHSNHPIAQSLKEAYGKEPDVSRLGQIEERSGLGVVAEIDGSTVLVGNHQLMKQEQIHCEEPSVIGTVVHVAKERTYLGYLVIADQIKETSVGIARKLKKAGVQKTVMLTGDREETAKAVAAELALDEVYAELLPGDKVNVLESLLCKQTDGTLAFVGDGINDAPALSRADIGIAMGGLGSDAAIEAADVVLMEDDPSKITEGIRISKRTVRIVCQNIVFSIGVKGLVLILGALGLASMWASVFADVGVMVLAVLNAMRVRLK